MNRSPSYIPNASPFPIEHREAYIALASRLGPAHVARLLDVPAYVVRKWCYRDRKARRTDELVPVIEAPSLVPDDADLEPTVTDLLVDALAIHGTMGAALKALKFSQKKLAEVDWSVFVEACHGGLPDADVLMFTSAQNDTEAHPFLGRLSAYSDALIARYGIRSAIVIGGFTYQLGLYRDHASRPEFYASDIRRHLVMDHVDVASDLVFAARANILPTVVNPIAKWKTQEGSRCLILPHAKQHLESIPRMLERDPKIVWTTGCCTVPNYTSRNAGTSAEWHHTIGAVIVERDGDTWHARHITADANGDFQDLDAKVDGRGVTFGHRIDSLVAGDIHAAQVDPAVVRATWGVDSIGRTRTKTGLVADLRPRRQMIHDVLDFQARNHHEIKSVKRRLERLVAGRHNVRKELADTAWLLRNLCRTGLETVVVKSNHDDALDRWLDAFDGADDEENYDLWCELNARHSRAIRDRESFDPFRYAMELTGKFVGAFWPKRFSSYEIEFPSGPVEFNLHGDRGNGGSRGSAMQFVRAAPKILSGHTHTPYRRDGHGSAGTSSLLNMGYNEGLSTWAHAHIVVYPSGLWTHVFIKDGAYRRPVAANQNTTSTASVGIAA